MNFSLPKNHIITFNAGGNRTSTTWGTVEAHKKSYLYKVSRATMSNDDKQSIFIDYNDKRFLAVLDFLRTRERPIFGNPIDEVYFDRDIAFWGPFSCSPDPRNTTSPLESKPPTSTRWKKKVQRKAEDGLHRLERIQKHKHGANPYVVLKGQDASELKSSDVPDEENSKEPLRKLGGLYRYENPRTLWKKGKAKRSGARLSNKQRLSRRLL